MTVDETLVSELRAIIRLEREEQQFYVANMIERVIFRIEDLEEIQKSQQKIIQALRVNLTSAFLYIKDTQWNIILKELSLPFAH